MRGEIDTHTIDLSSLETDTKILKHHSDKRLFNFFHAIEVTSASTSDCETGQEFSVFRTKAQGWDSTITQI